MRKYITSMLLLLSFFIIKPVFAEDSDCSYKEEVELREKASNIQANFETESVIVSPGTEDLSSLSGYVHHISLINLTDEFYVRVTNNYNDEYKLISGSNGIASFDWNKTGVVTTFTFKVYTTTTQKCQGIALKTFTLKTPRYNSFSNSGICQSEFPDHELCQQFVTFENIPESTFLERINTYREKIQKQEEERNKTFFDKLFEFLDKNKWVIIGVVIVVGGGTGTYVYFKGKKQRELGL